MCGRERVGRLGRGETMEGGVARWHSCVRGVLYKLALETIVGLRTQLFRLPKARN